MVEGRKRRQKKESDGTWESAMVEGREQWKERKQWQKINNNGRGEGENFKGRNDNKGDKAMVEGERTMVKGNI